MAGNNYSGILLFFILLFSAGCNSGKHLSNRYYYENAQILNSIADRYTTLYRQQPFSIEFRDKTYRELSFEMLSDTFRYIYNFNLDEPFLADTLEKYQYPTSQIVLLIADMRSIHCTWINNLDYYEKDEKKSLVFVAVRQGKLSSLLQGEKYYAIAFFEEPQFFDIKGRLADKAEKTSLRLINGAVYHKITNRICFAITGNFR